MKDSNYEEWEGATPPKVSTKIDNSTPSFIGDHHLIVELNKVFEILKPIKHELAGVRNFEDFYFKDTQLYEISLLYTKIKNGIICRYYMHHDPEKLLSKSAERLLVAEMDIKNLDSHMRLIRKKINDYKALY